MWFLIFPEVEVKEDFYYQVIPTFRIGLPGNKFVGEYHKDSKYNHQSYELNFNLGISGYLGDAALKSIKCFFRKI